MSAVRGRSSRMVRRMAAISWTVFLFMMIPSCVSAGKGNAKQAAFGIEGPEWQLVEVSGAAVSPLAGERQPFIRFDAAKKQAAGFSGCNNFFSGYELDGPSLNFGPVGATRMFCEGASGEVEMRFMEALEQTRAWKLRRGVLLLLKDGKVLAGFTIKQKDGQAPDLQSMTFLSKWFPSGKVTLSHGEYREPAAPGSASEIIVTLSDRKAFGMVNGRQTAAVILVTDPGGSGTFYDLALLTREAEGWVNTDSVFLGDRVKVHSVAIENYRIIVAMTVHGPNDPMCCPTLEVKRGFSVQGNRLVPAEGKTGGQPQITGTVWQWVQTLHNNDTKNVPKQPNNYTVRFLEDGRIIVKAGCNLKGGVYSTDGKKISLEITHSTMAACEEGSLEEQFIRDLTAAVIFFFKGHDLYLDLKYDTGTMRFSGQTRE
jgi:heat shock protein HslJ